MMTNKLKLHEQIYIKTKPFFFFFFFLNEVLLCVPHHIGEKLSNVAKTLGVILEAGLSVERHISSVVLFFFFFFFF